VAKVVVEVPVFFSKNGEEKRSGICSESSSSKVKWGKVATIVEIEVEVEGKAVKEKLVES
jgi:hypothetical protein